MSATPSESTTAPPPAPARRATWLGAALVAFVLLCITATLTLTWRSGARLDRLPVERYAPVRGGYSQRAVLSQGGRTLTQSSNAALRSAADVAGENAVLLNALQVTLNLDFDNDALNTLVATPLLRERIVIEDGAFVTETVAYAVMQSNSIAVVRQASGGLDLAFEPALPTLDIAAPLGQPQITTGNVASLANGNAIPYTSTLTLTARDAIETPAGRFDDCLKVNVHVVFGSADLGSSDTWYCAGVGAVRREERAANGALLSSAEALHIAAPAQLFGSGDATASLAAPPADSTPISGDLSQPLAASWVYSSTDRSAAVTAAPLATDERVYAVNLRGEVLTLDSRSGALLWRFQTGAPVFAQPALERDLLVVGSSDRRVHALDARSGAFRWAFATRDAIVAAPVIANGVVYAGSEDGTLYALDARNGALLRQFAAGGPIAAAVAVRDGVVYAGSEGGVLYALNEQDFSVRWAFAAQNAITTAPLVTDDVVYVGAHDNTVYALSAHPPGTSGVVLWQAEVRDPAQTRLNLHNGMLLATTTYRLFAFDAQSGALRWQTPSAYFYGSATAADSAVLAAGGDGLVQFNPADGSVIARSAAFGSSRSSGATVAGGQIYVGSSGGDIAAYAVTP